MEKETRKSGEILKEFINSLEKYEKRIVSAKIIDTCQISYMIFDNWKYSTTDIPFWAREKIDNLLSIEYEKRIFDHNL